MQLQKKTMLVFYIGNLGLVHGIGNPDAECRESGTTESGDDDQLLSGSSIGMAPLNFKKVNCTKI
jgi:hypothetical protein